MITGSTNTNSCGNPNNNSGDQDNIFKPKNIFYAGTPTRAILAAAVNAQPLFTIGEKDIFKFTGTNLVEFSTLPMSVKFVLVNTGKGSYGVGGITLTEDNIHIESVSSPTLTDMLSNPLVQQINLSEIGTDEIHDAFNALDPAVLVQSQAVAPIIINATVSGNPVAYLFLAAGGLYGDGELQATFADFTPLLTVNPSTSGITPIPYFALRLKAKGSGNTSSALQAGDIVEGWKDSTTYWTSAIYNGGTVSNRANYTPLVETSTT